jgi:two-component system, OmpR family, alkaline phosphatase synthesis response regulator PhoP
MSFVLVVEDDPDIAELIRHYLVKAGHEVKLVASGSEALNVIRAGAPDLLILDLMLPGVSGLEVCRTLRSDRATARLAIIMVTARAQEGDRVLGLESGADDYVTKPFSARELVARVGALLRRTTAAAMPGEGALHYATVSVDLQAHVVTDSGREVKLTAKEFLLLEYFLRHRGRVLSRDVLLTDVWGYQYTGGTRTVDVHVRRLREKLPMLAASLETVKQFGYKLLDLADEADQAEG